ncbi:MAG: type II toxin-antitoxin system RelE/ParE family toxin [bacterium]
MASYKILFKPSIAKDLRRLPKTLLPRILGRIEELKDHPLPRQSLKLSGGENLYRTRLGNYRIVYGVDKTRNTVTIHYVRHRREVYRRL